MERALSSRVDRIALAAPVKAPPRTTSPVRAERTLPGRWGSDPRWGRKRSPAALQGLGRDTNTGTQLISRRAGFACRRQGQRDGTRCFTGKTSGIGAEGNETGSNYDGAGRDTLFHR